MKKIKYLFVFIIGVLLFGGCDQEEEISYVFQDISAPTNVQAKFDISQDDKDFIQSFVKLEKQLIDRTSKEQ